jgi:hypothetical protein
MWLELPPDDENEPRDYKPGLLTVLITLLLVLAILSTLVWPLLQIRHRYPPTPTPGILQEA